MTSVDEYLRTNSSKSARSVTATVAEWTRSGVQPLLVEIERYTSLGRIWWKSKLRRLYGSFLNGK